MSEIITFVTLGGVELQGAAGSPLALAPKRVALLAYLAVARPHGPQQRDTLLALLYPETDTAHARMALRQLLREVRLALGNEAVESPQRETVSLNRRAVHCDVWEFEEDITAGRFQRAVERYTGPFLAGFHLGGCPDLEEWMDAERARLHRAYAGSLEQLALSSMQGGDAGGAATWWRQLLVHEPYASRVTLGLMEALAETGDRAAALRAAQEHAARLHGDFGAAPSREVEAFAGRLREAPNRRERRTRAVAERLGVGLAGRYRIEELLGVGEMALVFRARDLRHERAVALKVLRPELAAAVGPDRFLREIAIAARLNHPNILALHDSGEADGLLYYVMPFVDGESLRDLVAREGALSVGDAVAIARQVADALSHAHEQGVVHRDIKPENILISRGHVVVADFGVAWAVHVGDDGVSTSHGVAIGTPEYMSPEQASGRDVIDGRSDVYALGCVLYEMLGGKPPYTGTTPQTIMAGHLQRAVPRVRKLNRAVPPALDAVVARAIAKRPEDRYASASVFAEALVAAEGEAVPDAPTRGGAWLRWFRRA
jgi:DNA-binding SARP family transcriptional activator